ncbi:hypothetical protein LSUE1_G002428 [Lachnellula suecica]|uniref:Uncharacterized protein n=1 Tax=Lachnellula suecica TaxID=602035 RepID=A0A8T9CBK8_9HELO|nr:hypothetical protein LSUE1_G002428 [Lachnellula suecica]
MENLQLKVALRVLEYAGITTCLVGEIALNYYNVPRVVHDLEICVPENLVQKASAILRDTGLFGFDDIPDFDNYNEYKRGFPRLRSSPWISPASNFLILADTSYGLAPLIDHIVPRENSSSDPEFSSQILGMVSAAELKGLPMPRLPSLIVGLCQKYLQSYDDIAMIAAEQLVDGMNLDESWCERNLHPSKITPEARQLATRLAAGRISRLDEFSENTITCFIADESEAKRLQKIPGYE